MESLHAPIIMRKIIYGLLISVLLTTTSLAFASKNNFQFQVKEYHTQRQSGQTLDLNIRYALKDDLAISQYPDYRDLREKALHYLEPSEKLPADVYWELIAQEIGTDLMSHYPLSGISVQILVYSNDDPGRYEPGLHGPTYTVGDVIPFSISIKK
ncbi:MAG: hypothetical protein HY939_07100 [Gammaproteobacteria bacterium]|nr:hypothetical protein [Gammaproteobacteria bacterium]